MDPKLDAAQALLAAIVESSDDAIISKTLDGIVTSWNRSAERMFGYPAHEVIGRPITLIIPPEQLAEERMILDRVHAGERIVHYETIRRTRSGDSIEVSLTVSPVHDADGRLIGASKIARDITHRRRTEAALREADQRKDEFLTMLSHELRNPLAPILSAAQLLQSHSSPQQLHWAAQVIERQGRHLARLVDDLMDVARINTGRMELRPSRLALTDVLAAAVDSNRASIEEMGHSIELVLPELPVWVNADSDRLQQVYANLINNAAKFTEPNGMIRIEVMREDLDAVVHICDTGIGIAADKLGGIFCLQPQMDQHASRAHGGLGIGLSVARKLVELHGGSLTATSAGPGLGSEFTVRMPLAVADATSAGVATSQTVAADEQRRVLVVDDNVDAAMAITMLLDDSGYATALAHDGPQALVQAQCFMPDVVLLDLGLPGISGYQVARQLRECMGPGLLLIALTGWGQDKDRIATRNAGFDHHLTKPVAFQTIATLLRAPSTPTGTLRSA